MVDILKECHNWKDENYIILPNFYGTLITLGIKDYDQDESLASIAEEWWYKYSTYILKWMFYRHIY